MNILIKNGIILPMNASEGQELYYKGYLGIEDERIAFVSKDSAEADRFIASHKDDCRAL